MPPRCIMCDIRCFHKQEEIGNIGIASFTPWNKKNSSKKVPPMGIEPRTSTIQVWVNLAWAS